MNHWKEPLATEERIDNLNVYKKFIRFCSFFLIFLLVLEICSSFISHGKSIPDSAWSVTLNGQPTKLAPGKAMLPIPRPGDIISCTILLPEADFSYPALVFPTTRSTITVTNNRKTLFSSETADNRTYSSGVEQISLTGADLSKPVCISFTVEESNSVFLVPDIIFTEQRSGFSSFLKSRGATLVIALFLFFTGVIGTLICSASAIFGKKLMQLITISQFTFWASLCMFCHLKFILLFIHNETINALLELASFYLALVFAYMTIFPKLVFSKKHRRIYKILTAAYFAYCIVSLVLPMFTRLHVMDTFYITLIIVIASLGYSAYHCILQWNTRPERMTFTISGFMIMLGYAIFEEIRTLLHSIGISAFRTPEMLILSFGLVIFTASSLIDYFVSFKNATIQETVEESWKRFKEPNSVPGISGFQKTLALLKELEDSKSQYTIATISIDNIDELNLSPTPFLVLEDNFARLLHLVFSSYGITGNLGNGRFLVALPDMPEGKMKLLLRAFRELVRRDNENHPEAVIRYSDGYALSSDSEDEEIVKICQLANNSRIVQEQHLLQ